jgi:hypothetical protein
MLIEPAHTTHCLLNGLLTDLSHAGGELSHTSNPRPIASERTRTVVTRPQCAVEAAFEAARSSWVGVRAARPLEVAKVRVVEHAG